MKPRSTDEVLDLLDASFDSAALGAAMGLGLFWLLEARPRDETEIAARLGISPARCHYWLQLLGRAGLIEKGAEGFEPSATARSAIFEVYGQNTWALLAQEVRDRLPSRGPNRIPASTSILRHTASRGLAELILHNQLDGAGQVTPTAAHGCRSLPARLAPPCAEAGARQGPRNRWVTIEPA